MERARPMTAVCFYFQVHQPLRLRKYTIFDTEASYYADDENRRIFERVADKCYIPATRLLLDQIEKTDAAFALSFSITGLALQQMQRWRPDVIDAFRALASTGRCEFLAETSHHSLAFLYSRDEFAAQVDLQEQMLRDLIGVTPRVFRNTELIYNNDLAHYVSNMTDAMGEPRYIGMLAEGADHLLGHRSAGRVYTPPTADLGRAGGPFGLLLKNYRLSDDIAFRFSNRDWPGWPLTPQTFARSIAEAAAEGPLVNLFMDFETFGEHQWPETGIFEFLEGLPREVLTMNGEFLTVSEAVERWEPAGPLDCPSMVSWADTERDLSAWCGNAMQSNALHELYKLESAVKDIAADHDAAPNAEREALLEDWRRLTTSDHVYYMCVKSFADGEVHSYFNHYDSPYDAYINFMNVLDNLRERVERIAPAATGAGALAAGV
jgi:alpha-amylase